MKKLTKPKLKTNWIYIVIIIFVAFFVMIGILIYLKWAPKEIKNNQIIHSACLSGNEIVEYDINWRQTVGPVDIIIKNKNGGKEVFRFTVDSVFSGAYPVQPRKCGVYIMKEFNWDQKKSKPLPGFRVELWKYNYNGDGALFLTLTGENEQRQPVIFYSREFKIDFQEIFMALIKIYIDRIDFATVIKEIETKEDVFELLLKDITNKHPFLEGSLGLRDWTKDSRYFWADIFMGARVLGFFRIDTTNWKVDILPAPEGTLGGTAFNPEHGYITYDTGPGWIGIVEVAKQVYDEWRKEGKKIDFYLYNLFTKEKTLLATIDDPAWSFKPNWISDTELEYELPNGEKRVYKIEE